MKVWILVGDHGTRKSSVIRALTGVGRGGVYKMANANGSNFSALILPKTIQEMSAKLNLTPANFVKWIKAEFGNKGYDNIVITLRENGIGNRPDAAEYITHFVEKVGWDVQPVICFNTKYRPKGVISAPVDNTTDHANNEIASMIRRKWGWL